MVLTKIFRSFLIALASTGAGYAISHNAMPRGSEWVEPSLFAMLLLPVFLVEAVLEGYSADLDLRPPLVRAGKSLVTSTLLLPLLLVCAGTLINLAASGSPVLGKSLLKAAIASGLLYAHTLWRVWTIEHQERCYLKAVVFFPSLFATLSGFLFGWAIGNDPSDLLLLTVPAYVYWLTVSSVRFDQKWAVGSGLALLALSFAIVLWVPDKYASLVHLFFLAAVMGCIIGVFESWLVVSRLDSPVDSVHAALEANANYYRIGSNVATCTFFPAVILVGLNSRVNYAFLYLVVPLVVASGVLWLFSFHKWHWGPRTWRVLSGVLTIALPLLFGYSITLQRPSGPELSIGGTFGAISIAIGAIALAWSGDNRFAAKFRHHPSGGGIVRRLAHGDRSVFARPDAAAFLAAFACIVFGAAAIASDALALARRDYSSSGPIGDTFIERVPIILLIYLGLGGVLFAIGLSANWRKDT